MHTDLSKRQKDVIAFFFSFSFHIVNENCFKSDERMKEY